MDYLVLSKTTTEIVVKVFVEVSQYFSLRILFLGMHINCDKIIVENAIFPPNTMWCVFLLQHLEISSEEFINILSKFVRRFGVWLHRDKIHSRSASDL